MENKDNLSMLETKLSELENSLKEVVTEGLEIIKADPSQEKNVLNMFTVPTMVIVDHFMRETERTGTENVGKSVVKYAMFKKF